MRAPSPWPSLRRRARALASDVYAETVAEITCLAEKAMPQPTPGVPSLRARMANRLIAFIAILVSCVGRLERRLIGTNGLPVKEIREATLSELRQNAGALSDRRLLPSAYEVWIDERVHGYLRLRYAYDIQRLASLMPESVNNDAALRPLTLDSETTSWVRKHVEFPAPSTQLAVWRALKKRLYHYDAGVVAFFGFPRNFLLSRAQWYELLADMPISRCGVALDVGAGDGSLSIPFRSMFRRIVATELSTPLVCR